MGVALTASPIRRPSGGVEVTEDWHTKSGSISSESSKPSQIWRLPHNMWLLITGIF